MNNYFFSFLIIALLIFPPLAASNLKEKPLMYETYIDSNSSEISFVVDVGSSKEVYADPMWAIEIVSIIEDGKEVKASPSFQFIDDVNFDQIAVSSNFYIYKIKVNDLLFGTRKDGGDFDLLEYKISGSSRIIDITYKLKTVTSEKNGSELLTLRVNRRK